MPSKPFIYVEYRYFGKPWIEFDRTQVPNWAATQYERMVREHPDAEHRLRKEQKK